jgi:hypothetical protein
MGDQQTDPPRLQHKFVGACLSKNKKVVTPRNKCSEKLQRNNLYAQAVVGVVGKLFRLYPYISIKFNNFTILITIL